MDIKISDELVSITLTYTNGDVTNLYFSNGQFIACSNDNLKNAFPSDPPKAEKSYSLSKDAQDIRHMIDYGKDFFKELFSCQEKVRELKEKIDTKKETNKDVLMESEKGMDPDQIKSHFQSAKDLMEYADNEKLDTLINPNKLDDIKLELNSMRTMDDELTDNLFDNKVPKTEMKDKDGQPISVLYCPSGDGK